MPTTLPPLTPTRWTAPAAGTLAALVGEALPAAEYGWKWGSTAFANGALRWLDADTMLAAGDVLWLSHAYPEARTVGGETSTPEPTPAAPEAQPQPSPEPEPEPPPPAPTEPARPAPAPTPGDAHAVNRALGMGINLGGALEAPTEGAWGLTLEPHHFDAVAEAGLQSVRVPVKWSAHAAPTAPYTIRPDFLDRIDWVLDQAARCGLGVVLNAHHYDELWQDVAGHRARLAGLWRQIARRYRGRPSSVVFEPLNEPHGQFDHDAPLWDRVAAELVAAIRETNPTRAIMLGPVWYNSHTALDRFNPPDDAHLIATVHYYEPLAFTHQGFPWMTPPHPTGTRWDAASGAERVQREIGFARDWAAARGLPLNVGEFGVGIHADADSRVAYVKTVAETIRAAGASGHVFDLASTFRVWDKRSRTWLPGMREALV